MPKQRFSNGTTIKHQIMSRLISPILVSSYTACSNGIKYLIADIKEPPESVEFAITV